jgi:hypothetical protein
VLTLRRRPAQSVPDKTNWHADLEAHQLVVYRVAVPAIGRGAVYDDPRRSIGLRGDEGFFVSVVVEG